MVSFSSRVTFTYFLPFFCSRQNPCGRSPTPFIGRKGRPAWAPHQRHLGPASASNPSSIAAELGVNIVSFHKQALALSVLPLAVAVLGWGIHSEQKHSAFGIQS